jgi:hypothetical protein
VTSKGCGDLRISQDIVQQQEGRPSPEGKDREAAYGEGKASKGARAGGNDLSHGTRKGTLKEARNTANPMVGSGVQQTRKALCGANHQDGEKP